MLRRIGIAFVTIMLLLPLGLTAQKGRTRFIVSFIFIDSVVIIEDHFIKDEEQVCEIGFTIYREEVHGALCSQEINSRAAEHQRQNQTECIRAKHLHEADRLSQRPERLRRRSYRSA